MVIFFGTIGIISFLIFLSFVWNFTFFFILVFEKSWHILTVWFSLFPVSETSLLHLIVWRLFSKCLKHHYVIILNSVFVPNVWNIITSFYCKTSLLPMFETSLHHHTVWVLCTQCLKHHYIILLYDISVSRFETSLHHPTVCHLYSSCLKHRYIILLYGIIVLSLSVWNIITSSYCMTSVVSVSKTSLLHLTLWCLCFKHHYIFLLHDIFVPCVRNTITSSSCCMTYLFSVFEPSLHHFTV